MTRGIGHGDRVVLGVAYGKASLLAAAVCAGVACSSAAMAGGTVSDSSRYSDSGLLDAARGGPAVSTGPVNIGLPPADEMRVLEARREAELKRLSEKLKRATEQHGTQASVTPVAPLWTTDVAVAPADEPSQQVGRSALGARPSMNSEFGVTDRGRATVLLVMTKRDGRATDPILCDVEGCYVSNGPQAPATYHSFQESLSLSGRLGRGAGECNHSNACVFRNVDLSGPTTMVQPINLRFVHHDRREQSQVVVDDSCRVMEGRLSCSRPVRTQSYTLWVVPERLASEVGPDMLAAAVGAGLRTAQTAELPWLRQ